MINFLVPPLTQIFSYMWPHKTHDYTNITHHKADIFDLVNRGRIKDVDSCIQHDPRVISQVNYKGQSVLEYAVCHKQVEIAKLLMSAGAKQQPYFHHNKVVDIPAIIAENGLHDKLVPHSIQDFSHKLETHGLPEAQTYELGISPDHHPV